MDKLNIHLALDHIVLDSLDIDNSEEYRKLRNKHSNRNMFFSSGIISKEEQYDWYIDYSIKKDDYMFSIHLKDNHLFIGGIAIYDIKNGFAELGRILIDNDYRTQGYGSEAIKALCLYSFKNLNLDCIFARIYNSNISSIKAFEKSGFKVGKEENGVIKMIIYKSDVCY